MVRRRVGQTRLPGEPHLYAAKVLGINVIHHDCWEHSMKLSHISLPPLGFNVVVPPRRLLTPQPPSAANAGEPAEVLIRPRQRRGGSFLRRGRHHWPPVPHRAGSEAPMRCRTKRAPPAPGPPGYRPSFPGGPSSVRRIWRPTASTEKCQVSSRRQRRHPITDLALNNRPSEWAARGRRADARRRSRPSTAPGTAGPRLGHCRAW